MVNRESYPWLRFFKGNFLRKPVTQDTKMDAHLMYRFRK